MAKVNAAFMFGLVYYGTFAKSFFFIIFCSLTISNAELEMYPSLDVLFH